MSPMELEEQALLSTLNQADRDYYGMGHSSLTDKEYDEKMRRLRAVELALERALPGSPTQRVGGDLTGSFTKVAHTRPMLSLENVFSTEELISWFGEGASDKVTVEAKIDGLAVELRYKDGHFIQGVTRGDGTTGEDVTANLRTIRGIPLILTSPLTVDVRGEVYMARSTFSAINNDRGLMEEELFANPRNAAAGSLKLKSPAEVATRELSFVAYWSTLPVALTQFEMAGTLLSLGFPTLITVSDVKQEQTPVLFVSELSDPLALASAIDNIQRWRDLLDLDIDGAVIKINDRQKQSELGNKTKSPRWAVAYKFPPERRTTQLKDIVISVGRTGQVTPNAVLAPVVLSGATISAASLMNADEMVRIGNPTPGDFVYVERSAEVIPRVVGVHAPGPGPKWKFPAKCPFCQSTLEKRGVHIYDPNPRCPERVYARLKHATCKGAVDWDGMGEAQLRTLVKFNVTKFSELFALTPEVLQLRFGFKPAAIKKFVKERERVKEAPLWRKFVALGIEDVGSTLSKELARAYGSIESLIIAMDERPAEVQEITKEVAYKKLAAYVAAELDEISDLDTAGFIFREERKTGPLTGKTYVITGTLLSGTREDVSAAIEALGGLTKSAVTKGTNYLVVGDSPGGNKTAAAAKLGTIVLTEEQLYATMGKSMPALKPLPAKDY